MQDDHVRRNLRGAGRAGDRGVDLRRPERGRPGCPVAEDHHHAS